MISKITNGIIVLENELLYNHSVYIENGKITAVSKEDMPCDEIIDAEGNFISPGFIDLHIHGGMGSDFAEGDAEGVINAANFHLSHGTTTIFPTTLSADLKSIMEALGSVQKAINSGKILSNVGGVHLEGPYFSMESKGAQNPEFITPPKKEEYTKILEKYGKIIKRWSFAPELEGTDEFIDTLNEYGVIPSIGHTDAVYDDVMAAYEKGCRLITHFYSCTSTITREKGFRKLGVIESGYLIDDMDIELIADGCHVPRDLFRLAVKIKGCDHICLITDSMSLSGSDKKEGFLGGLPCKIQSGVAYLMDESAFAGSIATADRLVRFCYKDVLLPLWEAVKMITRNPARCMGLESKGLIREGFDADIVIFDDNIEIKKVIVGGKTVK